MGVAIITYILGKQSQICKGPPYSENNTESYFAAQKKLRAGTHMNGDLALLNYICSSCLLWGVSTDFHTHILCTVVGELPSMPVSLCKNPPLFGQANTGFYLAKGTFVLLCLSL